MMAEPSSFAASDRNLLIRVVKECQKDKVSGTQGTWKDFQKAAAPALSKTDPGAHDWKVTLDFGKLAHFIELE